MEMKLLNWNIGKNKRDQILAWGNAINHPYIPEGRYVHTSGITKAGTVVKEACMYIAVSDKHLTLPAIRVVGREWGVEE